MKIYVAVTLALLAALATSACATATIEAARELASQSSKASTAMENATLTVRQQHADIRRIEALQGLLVIKVDGDRANEIAQLQKQISDFELAVQTSLTARVNFAKQLAATYREYSLLATSDPAAGFRTEYGKLGTAVDSLMTALDSNPVSGTVKVAIGAGLEELLRLDQADRLLDGSRQIRELLEPLVTVLDREAPAALQIEGVYQNARYNAAIHFLKKDIVAPSDTYIADIIDLRGLNLVVAPKLDANAVLERKEAVTRDLERRRDIAVARAGQSYADAVEALKEIVAGHKKFEEGQPLDLARLIDLTQRLVAFVDAIRAEKEADEKAKAKSSVPTKKGG